MRASLMDLCLYLPSRLITSSLLTTRQNVRLISFSFRAIWSSIRPFITTARARRRAGRCSTPSTHRRQWTAGSGRKVGSGLPHLTEAERIYPRHRLNVLQVNISYLHFLFLSFLSLFFSLSLSLFLSLSLSLSCSSYKVFLLLLSFSVSLILFCRSANQISSKQDITTFVILSLSLSFSFYIALLLLSLSHPI